MLSLQVFALTKNHFRGQLPSRCERTLAEPYDAPPVLLGGNKLSGPIPASLAMASSLEYLSLANNSFTGHVPPKIGTLCMALFELSNNRLTATNAGGWEFLEGLTNCSALVEISLDSNRFGGAMPGSIARLSTQLQKLNLGGNRISGVMPPDIWEPTES